MLREKVSALTRNIIHGATAQQHEALLQLDDLLRFICRRKFGSLQREMTSVGVSIGSEDAAACLPSLERTRGYWLALINAVSAIRQLKLASGDKRAIEIVYPCCGPFGTLVIPVLCAENWTDVSITLIEYQQESFYSVTHLLHELQIDKDRVRVRHQDAVNYCPENSVDIVILECLFPALKKEGQVLITNHLCQFLNASGILIPQKIELSVFYGDARAEVSYADRQQQDSEFPVREHIASLLTLDKNTWHKIDFAADNYAIVTLRFPPVSESWDIVGVRTQMQLYESHWIEEYQCGLTYPYFLSRAPGYYAEKDIKVDYKLRPLPGLTFSLADSCCEQIDCEGNFSAENTAGQL